jgi:hypothetical protein
MMNIRQLFAKKPPPAQPSSGTAPRRLDVDALDHCVGGRMETDGVACYLRSTPPPQH